MKLSRSLPSKPNEAISKIAFEQQSGSAINPVQPIAVEEMNGCTQIYNDRARTPNHLQSPHIENFGDRDT